MSFIPPNDQMVMGRKVSSRDIAPATSADIGKAIVWNGTDWGLAQVGGITLLKQSMLSGINMLVTLDSPFDWSQFIYALLIVRAKYRFGTTPVQFGYRINDVAIGYKVTMSQNTSGTLGAQYWANVTEHYYIRDQIAANLESVSYITLTKNENDAIHSNVNTTHIEGHIQSSCKLPVTSFSSIRFVGGSGSNNEFDPSLSSVKIYGVK